MSGQYGKAWVKVVEDCDLLKDIWEKGETYPVWMSHGDWVTVLPPGFKTVAICVDEPEEKPLQAAE